MEITGEISRNMTAEVYGRSGRRPLHVLSNTDGGVGALWGVSEPLSGLLPTALPGSQVALWSATKFQWLLRVPLEGLGHHSMEIGQGVFSFHLPFPVLPILCYLYSRSANLRQENSIFPACISVLLINSDSLVRGFLNICKLLGLYLKKGQKSCYVVFGDLPPGSDVTDDITGNRERLYINI